MSKAAVAHQVDSPGDRAVLIELYSATDGESWTNNTNWRSDRPIREWHGVTNDANGRVTLLHLFANQLTGEIPTELGNLSNLQGLQLYNNQLTGEIPTELGNLSNLEGLFLSNQLTGRYQRSWGTSPTCKTCTSQSNQLTGRYRRSWDNLSNLKSCPFRQPVDGRDTDGVGEPVQPARPVLQVK